MPGIHLYSSNKLELLADFFARQLAEQPLPPLQKETILIQSLGMQRWLAMETAKRLNIWANCYCPFPNTFVREIYRLLLPGISDDSFYAKDNILWHLMDILQDARHEQHFEQVATYLASGDDTKLYQLAFETADLFDQYTLYRPQMILDWEKTANSTGNHAWQQITWCRLVERLHRDTRFGATHRARLLQLFGEKIRAADFDPAILPLRISVFGISSLPPYHLKVLAGLAHHLEIHFYVLNPCKEYWSDIVAARDIVKISRTAELAEDSLHLQEGNSLLASMGHLGRDFIAMLQEISAGEHDFFNEPGGESLLASIQDDILHLREIPADTPQQKASARNKMKAADLSLAFHSCHSPMREVEVLHDQLLEIFHENNTDGQIEPRHILVMAPAIDEYAPFIRAVFDAGTSGSPKIPYSIADQSIRKASTYIEAFFKILNLPHGRFSSTEIFAIVEMQAVRDRFGISETDLILIEHWIRETKICWGIDEEHKKELGLSPYRENTWRAGLDRLLLGYAMPSHDQAIFADILAYDHIEGDNANLLGRFLDYCETLFSHAQMLKRANTLAEWSEILLRLKEDLLLTDEANEAADRTLYKLLHELRDLQERATYDKRLNLAVIRSFLTGALDDRLSSMAGAAGFLSGGVTFCSMLPMRSIPFKVICLLGMNDGHYPRSSRKRSFDLMALEPKRGDRSRRFDDRYLFLETILSARRRLYISYIGQSVQDGSKRPPSVLVSELMDYIDKGFTSDIAASEPAVSLSNQLITLHHLQPFHPDYYTPDKKLFSYSVENCEAANSFNTMTGETPSLFPGPLPEPDDQFRQVELDELIRFFSHPARYLLQRIIGIAPLEESRVMETSEPFMLLGLPRYKLENEILKTLMAGKDCENLYRIRKAAGDLPHGLLAKTYFQQMVSELRVFHKTLADLVGECEFEPYPVNLKIGDYTLSGKIDNLLPIGLFHYRYATMKARDVIRSWLSHLVLNCQFEFNEQPMERNTYFAAKDAIWRYVVPENCRHHLQNLLEMYWQGLMNPLPFLPKTSFVYASEVHKGKTARDALQKAMKEWKGDGYRSQGEKNDPYNRLCHKNLDLASPLFKEAAEKILLTALQHREKTGDQQKF